MCFLSATSYDEDVPEKTHNQVMMKIKLMPLLAGVISLSVVATPFLVKAQSNGSTQAVPTQNQKNHHGGKWDKLNLNDAQKAELKKINDETRTQMQAVLTPDQQAKLKTMMENHRREHSQGQKPQAGQAGQRHGKQNPWASLNLTDAQKAKIKQIKDAKKARMQAVFTPEQKQQMQQMRQEWQQKHQKQGNQGN
jgi:protein CpxP